MLRILYGSKKYSSGLMCTGLKSEILTFFKAFSANRLHFTLNELQQIQFSRRAYAAREQTCAQRESIRRKLIYEVTGPGYVPGICLARWSYQRLMYITSGLQHEDNHSQEFVKSELSILILSISLSGPNIGKSRCSRKKLWHIMCQYVTESPERMRTIGLVLTILWHVS